MTDQRMCFVCVIVNRNRLIFQSMEQIGIGVKRVQRQGEVNLVMPQTGKQIVRILYGLHLQVNLGIALQVARNGAANSRGQRA